ncbi:MAG: hypothetical protein IJQ68_06585 [Methanobrevibacter sp.]|uniref:hypothetical protein n=1 Tax=Methanobrevibacter sp. TaxID=66852 RepID=UPI0025D34A00|nr:hypothetical protein [Methanobrevibacter sp.]MBR0271638.1 hypothetical protein [Methanobrevibacter sp.]
MAIMTQDNSVVWAKKYRIVTVAANDVMGFQIFPATTYHAFLILPQKLPYPGFELPVLLRAFDL